MNNSAKQYSLNSSVCDIAKSHVASYIDKSMQEILDMDKKYKAALGISSTVNAFLEPDIAQQNYLNSFVYDLSKSHLASYIDKSMQEILDMDKKYKAALGISSAVNAFLEQDIAKQNYLNSFVYDLSKSHLASYIDKDMQDILDMVTKHKAALGKSSALNNIIGHDISKHFALKSSVSELSNLFNNLDSQWRTVANVLMAADFSKIDLLKDKDIYPREYKKNILQQLENISQSPDSESIKSNFNSLPLWLKTHYVSILLFILGLIVQSYYQEYFSCLLPGISCAAEKIKYDVSDKPAREKIKKLESLSIEGVNLECSRFVTLEHLNVYIKPNQKSQVMDEVTFGKVILLLKKERNWAEIAFRDENGDIQQGWVFNRYLKKFN